MSVHTAPQTDKVNSKPVTISDILASKGKKRLSMVTTYDYSIACLADQAGLDMLLIGDSLGMVMLGMPDTNAVTLDEIIIHSRSVKLGAKRSLVVADMPFMTYETSSRDALLNAGRIFQESGVRAVKLEGGVNIAPQVKALTDAGIPVCGHIGLTPQRAAMFGGFKVQGKSGEGAYKLLQDAIAIEQAGAFAIVLEAIPAAVAEEITKRINIPTIGIGAGPGCDGQVLVYHDMMGLYGNFVPRFAKQYAQIGDSIRNVFQQYDSEVKDGSFPGPEHCFSITPEAFDDFKKMLK